MSSNINWNDVIKKEARGINDANFGEVQEVTNGFVITQKGLIDLETFDIPKERAESYDRSVLRFNVSENEAFSKYRGGEEAGGEENASSIDNMDPQLLSNQESETEKSTTTVPLME